ncbi:peptidoglycan DD-metalloendopeptidase family protein [Crossiella sp. CA-258035]|uniref:murein hydrolase activator EnvC family protein n=1 Tax=Crossiella sp. CA-258035 TaxID=2981138 RepID=UPI0024BCA8C9|nr:peptidoglycan DD-metalloendopeptidase family protein [Crossiella sp. CA-258035]WHT18043.1 peptidoglycan DD-metalloendopeptidase family protein [Crossiella sp. CA-258035]
MALALLTAALAGCAVAGADPTAVRSATPPSLSPASTRWTWPLPGRPPVLRRFTPPQHRYGPGHRGIDLGAPPGTPVLAAATGVVTFAGPVAGRGVVTLHHPNGLHTTYEPLTPQVRKGQHIPTATPLGHLTPGHPGCPAPACLHWGLRRHHTYLNPLHLLTRPTLRLLPLPRPTPAPPQPQPQAKRRPQPLPAPGPTSTPAPHSTRNPALSSATTPHRPPAPGTTSNSAPGTRPNPQSPDPTTGDRSNTNSPPRPTSDPTLPQPPTLHPARQPQRSSPTPDQPPPHHTAAQPQSRPPQPIPRRPCQAQSDQSPKITHWDHPCHAGKWSSGDSPDTPNNAPSQPRCVPHPA